MSAIKVRPLARGEVTFYVATEPEDRAPTGQDFSDPRDVKLIVARLERGDTRAWCLVRVTARWNGLRGVAYLGGCSLTDSYTETAVAVEHDLYADALNDLNRQLESMAFQLSPLVLP